MPQLISQLWFGTEESYFAYLHAQERVEALTAQGPDAIKAAVLAAGGGRGTDPFGLPSLWETHGNVAVLHIEGSLIAGNAGFMRLFGAIGYADIQSALAEIAADKDIAAVLLNIQSGGGQVDGLEDTGDMIRALDATKPVFSYTGGVMGSAAYWMGASARHITAARTAQVGSVGTLIVHMERSQQLRQNGVTPTVVRYGKYKALANPVEPLSEEGKKELQAIADEAGSIFVEYVAGRRGMTVEKFQATAGEGRVFMGRQALEVGLVDAVSNLSGAINQAKSLDNRGTHPHNPRNPRKGMNMKLSKKSILAIAAGVALDKLGLAEPEANLEGVKLEGDALTLAQAEANEISSTFDTRVAAATTAATASLTAKVEELTTKLAAAETSKATFEAASNDFQAKLATSADHAAKADAIVKASISVMSVAMGGSADVGASLTGSELLAEHDRLAEQFKKKFPTGGVAAVQGPAKTEASEDAPSPLFMSLVKSLASSK